MSASRTVETRWLTMTGRQRQPPSAAPRTLRSRMAWRSAASVLKSSAEAESSIIRICGEPTRARAIVRPLALATAKVLAARLDRGVEPLRLVAHELARLAPCRVPPRAPRRSPTRHARSGCCGSCRSPATRVAGRPRPHGAADRAARHARRSPSRSRCRCSLGTGAR